MLNRHNLNQATPLITYMVRMYSTSVAETIFSVKKFQMWRRRIKASNLSYRRLGSNKDAWHAPHKAAKPLLTGWQFLPVHAQYKSIAFRRLPTPNSSEVPRLYRYSAAQGVQTSLGVDAGWDIVSVRGYNSTREFTVPTVICSGARAVVFRVNQANNSLWYKGSSTVSGVSLTTKFFYAWYREFTWALFYYLFIKIRYKGKSYKWYRRGGALILRFGYSHIVSMRIPSTVFSKKAGRMKLIFFGTSRYELRRFLATSIAWRPMNIYNGRGLRFARQLVRRKAGKVSAYR